MLKGESGDAARQATLELVLSGQEQTEALGRALGGLLAAGQVLLLIGELGAGKTSLAKGLARGLGVDQGYVITSPTFTLLNVYPGRLEFFHADLYRLEAGEAADLELIEEAAAGVLAVEWPERAPELWPAEAIQVEMAHDGEDRRRARITGPATMIEMLQAALQI